jgi:SAM-dependent methyltransferase
MGMLATVRGMLKALAKDGIRWVAPLALRQWMVIWFHRQKWIGVSHRRWWLTELLRDFSERDVNAYHKFLWAHHLAYAVFDEGDSRFGADYLIPSRRMFFSDLCRQLQKLGIHPNEVGSVLEVGCSLGYQLRHVETELFPSVARLDGIDIEEYASRAGTEYLRAVGSKVSLRWGDMRQLDELVGQRVYDVILCTGTLLYLKEAAAAAVIRMMLSHSRIMVALAGLAHPAVDNAHVIHSGVRSRDATVIHNFDQMVKAAGGRVLARR